MWWDIIVVGLCAAQLVGLGTVAYFGWKIYKEPVGKATTRVAGIVKTGHQTGLVIQKNYAGKEARIVALGQKWAKTYADANKAATIPEMPITYRSLMGGWGSVRMGLGLLSAGRRMFAPKPPPGPAAAKRPNPSLAHRMGFVPPVVERVGRAAPLLRAAYGTYRELRRRGNSLMLRKDRQCKIHTV